MVLIIIGQLPHVIGREVASTYTGREVASTYTYTWPELLYIASCTLRYAIDIVVLQLSMAMHT